MIDAHEAVICALEDYLRLKCGNVYPTLGGRTKTWAQTDEQPALYLELLNADDNWSGTVLAKTELKLQAWVYVKTGEDDIPRKVLSQTVWPLRAALAIDGFGNQVNLRSKSNIVLCRYVRIEGTSHYFPGLAGNQAIAVVPISILLP